MIYRDLRIQARLHVPFHRNKDFSSFVTQYYEDGVLGSDPHEQITKGVHIMSLCEDKLKVSDIISQLESDLLEVLVSMEKTGVYMDIEKLKRIWKELEKEKKKLHDAVLSWEQPFNLNSSAQLQVFLFEKKWIKPIKKTKTGWSTDEETLKILAKDHHVCSDILAYRHVSKLLSTYVVGIQKFLDAYSGKFHTTYDPIGASTGRMSSDSPNLQNIPSGDDWSDEIKSCFCPQNSNFQYAVADYSQVELRILACLSGDEALLDVFRNEQDVHESTARVLFPEVDTISPNQRSHAKSVNFWVIYGITGFGLSKMMPITPNEWKEYIQKFYDTYPKVRTYYDGLLEQGRKDGYVSTFFGRKRWLPGLNDANKMVQQTAEREAINMPIQGTSADIIKMAMVQIHQHIIQQKYESRMIMQVHDELVFEVHKDEQKDFCKMIRKYMESVVDWEIPLSVSVGSGQNWSEAK